MTRNSVISILASILLHGGVAGSGYLFKEKPVEAVAEPEIPSIALDLPPPPEPEEPEIVEDTADAPTEIADLAPPMQNDMPSAVIDSPFVQQIQAPPPPGLNRPAGGITIPTNTRPNVGGGGKSLGAIFDLAALDKRPTPTVQPKPPYPFELKRAGIKGEVLVGFIVDSTGAVQDPFIVRSSNGAFDAIVLATVVKWRFRPGQKGGVNVSTRNVQILIPFSGNAD